MLREKTLQAFFLIFILFYYPFLALDNSIAYMFNHTAHAYAHTLLHKMDESKRNILKGTVKGNTLAIQHRVCGDHEFSGTQDSDTGWRSTVDNVSD